MRQVRTDRGAAVCDAQLRRASIALMNLRERDATEEPTLEEALATFRAERSPRDLARTDGASPAVRFTSAMRALRRAISQHPIDARLQEALAELHEAEKDGGDPHEREG
jgi:hypothetical protein